MRRRRRGVGEYSPSPNPDHAQERCRARVDWPRYVATPSCGWSLARTRKLAGVGRQTCSPLQGYTHRFGREQLEVSPRGQSLNEGLRFPSPQHDCSVRTARCPSCPCLHLHLRLPLHVLTSSGIPWPLPGAARPSRVRVRVSRLHCQRDPELPASCCASVYTESSAHMRRGHSHAFSRDHGNPLPHR